jgi:TOMM system kinase/cyclase fusion protein
MDTISINRSELRTRFSSSQYTLHEEIGAGGFGKVYRATNKITHQTVAIKTLNLNPDFDEEKRKRYVERFERETFLGSRLQHPNIVRLLDKGQCEEKLLYAVFEFVEGQSLKDYLSTSGPLNPIEAAEIMSQVLDALAHAHSQGVIHRDLKPANIMLTNQGAKLHSKVLDFGVGTLMHEVRHLDYKSITLTQEILGTPSYSAPEQLRGEPPTPKTDLYVWGLVFIECLTGVPAISGSSLASIFQKQLNPSHVPLPSALVSHPVADVLRRVLNKKVSERTDSALEIYKSFTQLNFASLVGDISQADLPNDPTSSGRHEITTNETLIGNLSFLNSGLTERKQITAMSIVLNLHSTNGIAGDHEVLDALHRDQKTQCVDIAVRYGAAHIGTLGNSMLFYFGYPTASDSDSRLCARAALELISRINRQNALRKHSQYVETKIRIGVHSGLMTMYPDMVPDGDTANVAMNLANLANDNQILCSETTRKILETHIEFEPHPVGKPGAYADDMALYSLVGEKMAEAFGFLRASRRHQSFIGREEELCALANVIQNQKASVMHVYGEAGIGKSRLVFEFRNQAHHYTHFVAQCLPEYKNTALHPIIGVLQHKYSLNTSNNEGAIKRLQSIVREQTGINENQAIQVLCAWLNITLPEDFDPVILSPDEWKNTLFDTLNYLLCRKDLSELNERNLFIVEDIHWADPTSIEFIARFIQSEHFREAKHVLVSTSRQPLVEMLATIVPQQLEVKKLSNDKSLEFIAQLFDKQKVASSLVDIINSRTDGVPLFIEELVNMLKQKNLLHFNNGMFNFISLEKMAEVPGSLRDSLQQKLDALNSAKHIAQLAAAIGREFTYSLLLQSSQEDEAALQVKLEELLNTELIYIQRRVDGDCYIFKHALIRDAAYDSMPSSNRQKAHKQIAQSLTQSVNDPKDGNLSLLAMHWGEAHEFENAIKCGNIAATAALKRSSAAEAINQATKIQEWITHLAESAQVDATLANYSLLTSAYMETKGWASEEVLHYSEASLNLLKSSKKHDELVPHLWWKMLNGVVGGKRAGLLRISHEMDELLDNVSLINKSAIRCCQGFFQFAEGNRQACIKALQESINFYDKDADRSHQQIFGFDPGVFAKATLGRAYADVNQQSPAFHYVDEAVKEAKEYNNIPSIGISLMYYAIVHQLYGHKKEVNESCGELIALAEKHDLSVFKSYGQMLYDWSTGDTEKAEQVLEDLTSKGSLFSLGQFQSFYADVYIENAQYELAIRKIDECLALNNNANEHYFTAQLLFKKAACLVKKEGNENAINMYLEQALNIARHQGAIDAETKIERLKSNYALQNQIHIGETDVTS